MKNEPINNFSNPNTAFENNFDGNKFTNQQPQSNLGDLSKQQTIMNLLSLLHSNAFNDISGHNYINPGLNPLSGMLGNNPINMSNFQGLNDYNMNNMNTSFPFLQNSQPQSQYLGVQNMQNFQTTPGPNNLFPKTVTNNYNIVNDNFVALRDREEVLNYLHLLEKKVNK